jgi:hypothetical protein
MNLRHAAALALVGWYLMVPPPDTVTLEQFRKGEMPPLTIWIQLWAFDSAKECQDKLAQLVHDQKDPRRRDTLAMGRCIASDDPRLKSK